MLGGRAKYLGTAPSCSSNAENSWLVKLAFIAVLVNVATLFVTNVNAIRTFGIYIPSLFLVLCFIRRGNLLKEFRHPLLLMFVVYVGWAFITILISESVVKGLAEFHKSWEVVLLVTLLSVVGLRSENQVRWIIVLLSCGSIYLLFMAVYEFVQYVEAHGRYPKMLAGTNRDFAWPLVLIAPFLLALTLNTNGLVKKALWGGLLVLSFVLLVASASRAMWLATILSLGLFILLGVSRNNVSKKIIPALAVLFVIATVVATSLPNSQDLAKKFNQGLLDSYRMNYLWPPYLKIASESPVVGYGQDPEVVKQIFFERHGGKENRMPTVDDVVSTHNSFLKLTIQSGVLGLVMYLGFAMLLMWYLFGLVLSSSPSISLWASAILTSFIGHYLIRGFVEDLGVIPLSVHLGLTLALLRLESELGVSE